MATVLGMAALGGTALAGSKQISTVSISGNTAGGALGDSRASSNTVEAIGCHLLAFTGSPLQAYCYARDQFNKTLQCSTTDPGMVAAASFFGPTVYVQFAVNANGSCNYIWNTNMSWYAPPVP